VAAPRVVEALSDAGVQRSFEDGQLKQRGLELLLGA
jgi:hypothetical protein